MLDLPWLTILWLLPATGAVVLTCLPMRSVSVVRALAGLFAAATLAIAGGLFVATERGAVVTESFPWIATLGASYHLAFDGAGGMLALVASFLSLVAVTSSFRNVDSDDRAFHAVVLAFTATGIGAFLARDLLLFYCFFEASLIPLFVLVGWWGHEQRVAAATRFLVTTALGGLFLLLGLLAVWANGYRALGAPTFDMHALAHVVMPPGVALGAGAAILVGFALRTPLFPLHTWFPETQSEAPTGASVLLSGVSLPLGAYGLLLVGLPLLPHVALDQGVWVAGIGIVALLYGACLAMVQHDMKKRLAYVVLSQLGLVLIASFALDARSLAASLFHVTNLGLVTTALLVLVGILDERTGVRNLWAFQGLGGVMPRFTALFGASTFLLIGIPGGGIFAGELLLFQGIFARHPSWALVAAISVVFVATYMLMLLRRLATGPVETPPHVETSALRDLTLRETVIVAALLAASLGLGLRPQAFLDRIDRSTRPIAETVQRIRFDRLDEEIAEREMQRLRGPATPPPAASEADAIGVDANGVDANGVDANGEGER